MAQSSACPTAPVVPQVYEYGPAPEFSRTAWTTVKATHTHDFPNLPYLFDGDLKLVQSMAILRYVAREYGAGRGLCAEDKSVREQAHVDLLLEQAIDLRNAVARSAYGNACGAYLAGPAVEQLALWQRFFERPAASTWAAGEVLTIADFVLAEALEHISTMAKETIGRDLVADFPGVAAYLGRFLAVPEVARYRADPAYLARPFNGATAAWR